MDTHTMHTATIKHSESGDGPEREVRFAVVIYGGVSLTIYINGIVQELLNLVQSTAHLSPALTPLQKVYRELAHRVGEPKAITQHKRGHGGQAPTCARPGRAALREDHDKQISDVIHTSFKVDILTGTSAGGINAIYLAKALANDLNLESLKEMWITEADMDKLLNDSKVDPKWIEQASPPSLLNSRWMYLKLLTALNKMNPADGAPRSCLVDDLDLFCTTTDLHGLVVDVALTDENVNEQRYRNVYHFQRRTRPSGTNPAPQPAGELPHDFVPEMDPFLAFAARCTSSFPLAFEPMQLGDIWNIVTNDPKFRAAYEKPKAAKSTPPTPPGASVTPNTPLTLPDHSADMFGDDIATLRGAKRFAEICSVYQQADSDPKGSFANRSFGDGGYLDNKPFTYAIETIKKRHADLRVDRKLIYVEPSPETLSKTPPPGAATGARPTFVENSLDALVVLPRYETIRQDIESVIRWNADVARLQRVLTFIDTEAAAAMIRERDAAAPLFNPLSDKIYLRLRLSGATDQIGVRLSDAMGVDPASASGQALRSIADAWRDLKFGEVTEDLKNLSSLARFLQLLDFDHCERLIRFLRGLLQRQPVKDGLKQLAAITARFTALSEKPLILDLALWEQHAGALECWEQYLDFITDPNFAAQRLHRIKPRLDQSTEAAMLTADDVGRDARVLWLFHQNNVAILNRPSTGEPEPFPSIVDQVARQVLALYGNGVTLISGTPPLSAGNTMLQTYEDDLNNLLAQSKSSSREIFDRRDIQMYPIVFGTSLGEFEPIDIFRISPNETTPIAGTSPPGVTGNPTLQGEKLDAFGAFLDFDWRFSDMLRGRLDGAERLITSVLPDSDQETCKVREDLITRAQTEIAREWKGFQDRLNKKPSNQKIELINQLRTYATYGAKEKP